MSSTLYETGSTGTSSTSTLDRQTWWELSGTPKNGWCALSSELHADPTRLSRKFHTGGFRALFPCLKTHLRVFSTRQRLLQVCRKPLLSSLMAEDQRNRSQAVP